MNLGPEQKLVAIVAIFVFVTFISTSFLMEQTTQVTRYGKEYSFSSDLPVKYTDLSEASSSTPKKIKAEVKGSIYETGSNMTVFGACFDGNAYLLPAADAKFTAWYPNGTIVVGPNATMDKIYSDVDNPNGTNITNPNGTGRWKIHVTMGDTIGTYLTEMRCEYSGEWAIAFGEWQNPEWVARIAATQGTVNTTYALLQNVSNDLTNFSNTTQNNFNTVLAQIANMSSNVTTTTNINSNAIRELKQSLDAIDSSRWVLDVTNPFYVLGSDAHNFVAIDVMSPDRVAVVSSDGYLDQWDGQTWVEYQPDAGAVQFRGVSQLPANTVYAWGVGNMSGSPVISVNGAASTVFIPPSGSPTALNDVRLFQQPNNPSGYYYALLLADTGQVYFSNDSAATWSTLGSVGSNSVGRIGQVVDNVNPFNQVNGWASLVGQGDTVAWTDGASFNTYTIPSYVVKDVSLIYADTGWIIAEGASDSRIYLFNGSNISLQYTIEDSIITPTSIRALEQNDVWATTNDPSVMYHYNGRTWEYSTVGFSQMVSVIINFGNASSSFGLKDMSLYNDRVGYAVGGDGLILVFQSESKAQYDNVVSLLTQLNSTVNTGFSNTNASIYATSNATQALVLELNSSLTQLIISMNASLSTDISNLQLTLNDMNTTMNYKLDNILSNVTFTQLYLENTMYPMVNATYQNTLTILTNLGIISAQINQTIQLQNDTLTIVNATDSKVDILLNRSSRIRSWVTQ